LQTHGYRWSRTELLERFEAQVVLGWQLAMWHLLLYTKQGIESLDCWGVVSHQTLLQSYGSIWPTWGCTCEHLISYELYLPNIDIAWKQDLIRRWVANTPLANWFISFQLST
jgi:hypothetical protein